MSWPLSSVRTSTNDKETLKIPSTKTVHIFQVRQKNFSFNCWLSFVYLFVYTFSIQSFRHQIHQTMTFQTSLVEISSKNMVGMHLYRNDICTHTYHPLLCVQMSKNSISQPSLTHNWTFIHLVTTEFTDCGTEVQKRKCFFFFLKKEVLPSLMSIMYPWGSHFYS